VQHQLCLLQSSWRQFRRCSRRAGYTVWFLTLLILAAPVVNAFQVSLVGSTIPDLSDKSRRISQIFCDNGRCIVALFPHIIVRYFAMLGINRGSMRRRYGKLV
jgi:hypothetical protein